MGSSAANTKPLHGTFKVIISKKVDLIFGEMSTFFSFLFPAFADVGIFYPSILISRGVLVTSGYYDTLDKFCLMPIAPGRV